MKPSTSRLFHSAYISASKIDFPLRRSGKARARLAFCSSCAHHVGVAGRGIGTDPDPPGLTKSKRWTPQDYKSAVRKGGGTVYGLRDILRGFDAKDGFDLRYPEAWTASQKKQVREYYAELKGMTGQATAPVKIRNPENLERAFEAFHPAVKKQKRKRFKAILIPDPTAGQQYVNRETGEIESPPPPRLIFTKRKIRIKRKAYTTDLYLFDPRALVTDPVAEIIRGYDSMPNATSFFQAQGYPGQKENLLQGTHRSDNIDDFINYTLMIMDKYDGVTPITEGKHKGHKAKDHYWGNWLQGMYGYELDESLGSPAELGRMIEHGRAELKKSKARKRQQKSNRNIKGRGKR